MKEVEPTWATFMTAKLLSLLNLYCPFSSSQDQNVEDVESQIRMRGEGRVLLEIPRLGTPAIPLRRALRTGVVNNN